MSLGKKVRMRLVKGGEEKCIAGSGIYSSGKSGARVPGGSGDVVVELRSNKP